MLTVRRMAQADLERVAQLSGQLGYPVALSALDDRFARIASDPRQALFVAEDAGRVIGWIHVHPQVLLESGSFAEIGGLVVDASVRRSGAGRALVAEAERFARTHGFVRLCVRSNVARVEAHAFYPALGFKRLKTQHVYEKALSDERSGAGPERPAPRARTA
ncbi:MAG: GNAT family N-acetyltransferase [Myxococcaceae bacterium]|nr:GNAT family N-acetyltransferase [Myxococcaceae bacterium]